MEDVKNAFDTVRDAFEAGLKSIEKAWDSMDAGLKQWIINGISMAVSFIPIAGPLISCIMDGTFTDM